MLALHKIENIYRKFLKLNIKYNHLEGLNEVKNFSYYKIPNFISLDDARYYRACLEDALESSEEDKYKLGYYTDFTKCDRRFFLFQRYSNKIEQQLINNKKILEYYSAITGRKTGERTLMANHIISHPKNLGSGGGWHKDTRYMTYFKAFIYLNDVDHENGPLQIIPGTHSVQFLETCYKEGININKFTFEKDEIEIILKKFNKKVISLIGKAGDLIIANTKCLHRGKPLKKSERYAFTLYFADPKFSKRFIAERLNNQFFKI